MIASATVWLTNLRFERRFFFLALLLFSLVGCGAPDSGCPEGTVSCGGACLAVSSDDSNCGACGVLCAAGTFCSAGKCELHCGTGQAACGDGSCTGLASDTQNCGTCDNACTPGQFCDAGGCTGACSGLLCPGPNGSSECAHLESDPDHCGSCGHECAPGQECKGGSCVAACPTGRTLCGSECVDLLTSGVHCGVCGNACGVGVACESGSCESGGCSGTECPCPEGQTRCGTACIDTKANPFHCGACDAPCASAQSCESGSCKCPNEGILCGETCVDGKTDGANCGACGVTCSGGKSCDAGTCKCSNPNEIDCDGTCIDPKASLENCGSCGKACVGLETCEDGVCFYDVGDECGGAAKNVSITKLSLFQVVEIPLFASGTVTPTNLRVADIIEGKAAMMRVHLDVAAGFSARSLSARVYLDNGGPQAEAFFSKKSVSVDSTQGDLGTTLNVSLPADKLKSSTKFYVELVECSEGITGTEGVIRVPATGTSPLDARKTGSITIAFLPIRFNNIVPDTSEAALKKYKDELLKLYGATEIVTSVLPEYGNYSGTVNMNSLLDAVRSKRGQDDPADNVYYYGLVKPTATFAAYCNSSCTTGVAYLPGGYAPFRAGIGIGFGDGQSAGTLAHEIGHNHDRPHAPCGGAGDPDPSYPYSGGGTGVWGYDLPAGTLKNPANNKDLMGYCSPSWVSDYNYNLMTDVIANVSINPFRVRGEAELWDAVSVSPTGVEWSEPQAMRSFPMNARVEAVVYDSGGNEVDRVDAYRFDRSEDQGYLLVVPPKQSGWYAIGQSGEAAIPYP